MTVAPFRGKQPVVLVFIPSVFAPRASAPPAGATAYEEALAEL